MSREGFILLMTGVAIVLLALMAWGWWGRRRRDRALRPLTQAPATSEGALARERVLHVATTHHDQPMNRAAVAHLSYRARGDAIVRDDGLLLGLAGEPDVFVPAADLVAVDRARLTIDRVVEKDGLVRVSWRVIGDTIVDSYLRVDDAAATAAFVDALLTVVPKPPAGDTPE